MSTYTLVVFLHIASAVLLLATSIVGGPLVRSAVRRATTADDVRAFLRLGRPMARLSPMAALLVLATGVYLTSVGRFWALGWIQAAIVFWLVNSVVAAVVVRRAVGALATAAAETSDATVGPRLDALRWAPAWSRGQDTLAANDAVMLAIMTLKPSLGGALFLFLLANVAVAGARLALGAQRPSLAPAGRALLPGLLPTVVAGAALAPAGATLASPLAAQKLHVNDRWEDCAIVIDPALTQAAWRRFVAEVGVVAYFRPLDSARPLGARNVEISVLQSATRIDDADDAWNDTFSHPDSTHWLFDGDALVIPGLMVRAGVTDRVDVGAYYTRNFDSNYGIVGAQLQYGLASAEARGLDAAARASGVWLVGPDDLVAGVYGLDLVASREWGAFSPYAGLSGSLAWGRERTSKVDLDSEVVPGIQGMLGVSARLSAVRLGAEVGLARVTSYAFRVAVAL